MPTTQSSQGIKLSNQFVFAGKGHTGTGAAQTIAHGLGRTPDFVWVQPDDPSSTTITSISADKDNITLTCTLNKTFSVKAEVF